MPIYKYQAKSYSGKISNGTLEGDDEADVRYQLRTKKLIPLKVERGTYKKYQTQQLYQKKFKVAKSRLRTLNFFKPKIKNKDLQIFTRQLSVLINAGIPLMQSLEILHKSSINKSLKKALEDILARISEGKKIEEALKQHPHIFNHFYLNMVKAGEEGGILDTTLNQIAAYIEKITALERKIKGAATYPIVIAIISVVVVIGMLIFIVPKFQNMFKGAKQELPTLTLMIIDMSEFIRTQYVTMVIMLFFSVMIIRTFLKTSVGIKTFDYIKLSIPAIKDFILKSSMAKFSKTISCLISAGVPIIECIEISSKTANNKTIENILLKARKDVAQGELISQSLAKNPILPSMVIQMIAVGEETGALDQTMEKVAEFYETEVDATVDALTKLMEPAMIVIIGGIIGFIVIALYLPIFQMANTVGT